MRSFDHDRPELFEGFVRYKRSLGYGYPEQAVDLVAQMAAFLKSRPCEEVVSESAARDFSLRREGEAVSTRNKRASMVRQFALYLREVGVGAYVPDARRARDAGGGFVPRIITEEEMARVMRAAESPRPRRSGSGDPEAHGTLLSLLWCCGLRLGEALSLTVADVDLEAGTIVVRRAKYGRTRLLPVSESLLEVLRGRVAAVGGGDGAAFLFPSGGDGRLGRCCAASRIKRTMADAGVLRPDGTPPRVHDIRHSYAVAALAKMDAAGIEARRALPLLCAYMGHSDIKSTEYYLRFTDAAHPGVHERMAGTYVRLYGEVSGDA